MYSGDVFCLSQEGRDLWRDYLETRQIVRHLVEVAVVLRGVEPWAKAMRKARHDQGRPMPEAKLVTQTKKSKPHCGIVGFLVNGSVPPDILRLVASYL